MVAAMDLGYSKISRYPLSNAMVARFGCFVWSDKASVEKAIVHIIFFITSKINLNQTKRSEFSRINNCLKFAVKRHMIVCKF